MKTSYLTRVVDRLHSGWLKVELGSGDEISIPYSTKVNVLKTTNKFEFVEILEGKMAKHELAVPFLRKLRCDTYSYFTDERVMFSKLNMRVDRKASVLLLDNKRYRIKLSDDCKNGTYYVGFPIKKKIINKDYSDELHGGSRFFDTWFPLIRKDEFNISRFLHYGSYSEGCITVSHHGSGGKSWSEIFFKIMHSRINNAYLALLEVN